MGLFSDKLDILKQKAEETIKNAGLDEKFDQAKKNLGEGMSEFKESNAESKALRDEAKAPVEGAIARYTVIYKGGFEQKPKKKSDSLSLGLNIMQDSFQIKPEYTAKEQWFGDTIVVIPYEKVKKYEIKERQVSSMEAFLSSDGETKSLEQKNNIEITYINDSGKERVIRMEMLTGFSVYTQAAKCRELTDLLREHDILQRIEKNNEKVQSNSSSGGDVLEQIEKLSNLRDKGIIGEAEFNEKKAELLSKL